MGRRRIACCLRHGVHALLSAASCGAPPVRPGDLHPDHAASSAAAGLLAPSSKAHVVVLYRRSAAGGGCVRRARGRASPGGHRAHQGHAAGHVRCQDPASATASQARPHTPASTPLLPAARRLACLREARESISTHRVALEAEARVLKVSAPRPSTRRGCACASAPPTITAAAAAFAQSAQALVQAHAGDLQATREHLERLHSTLAQIRKLLRHAPGHLTGSGGSGQHHAGGDLLVPGVSRLARQPSSDSLSGT